MTLKNAKHRFEAIGYEVDRGKERRYRFRRVGAFRWISGDCLDAMLTAAMIEHTTARKPKRRTNL